MQIAKIEAKVISTPFQGSFNMTYDQMPSYQLKGHAAIPCREGLETEDFFEEFVGV
ncbi:hypothetical protein M1K46_22500 [Fictibacillus sp. WQ 8-8]|uniref:hypothetical protein n=1 Tax=Fictibacillus sp. WQ 8-8 TaxID=2938788 RepID=UPI00210ECCA3|nr:hypothetical protein [Fictibacillus sp. WQ 8-8]MCQ6268361.1 hypothetical protein [Fictibacillus sp. WQ 8-8]